jgi:hypothetical protein
MAYKDQNDCIHMEKEDFSCPREWQRYQQQKDVPGAVFRLRDGNVFSNARKMVPGHIGMPLIEDDDG